MGRATMVSFVIVAMALTGCAAVQEPVETIPVHRRVSGGVEVQPVLDFRASRRITSYNNGYAHDGVRVRVTNDTGQVQMVHIRCDFIRADDTVLSPDPRDPNETTAVLRMMPYTRRWVNVWSTRNSPWLERIDCRRVYPLD